MENGLSGVNRESSLWSLAKFYLAYSAANEEAMQSRLSILSLQVLVLITSHLPHLVKNTETLCCFAAG